MIERITIQESILGNKLKHRVEIDVKDNLFLVINLDGVDVIDRKFENNQIDLNNMKIIMSRLDTVEKVKQEIKDMEK